MLIMLLGTNYAFSYQLCFQLPIMLSATNYAQNCAGIVGKPYSSDKRGLDNRASTVYRAGMAFLYALLQLSLWWFFHTTAIFWKVNFPFHARSFQLSHKVKFVHLAIVLVSLVVPLVPIITVMADFAVNLESDVIRQARNITFTSGGLGFRIIRFPPILCSGSDSDAVFYSTVLPINILLVLGSTELVFIFYGLLKVSYI